MSETKDLASYVVNAKASTTPDDVRHEAKRAILNFVGCAIGGSQHPAMDRAMRALGPFSGKPDARVLARKEKFDALHTSLMNGISSHVFDYDDTTPQNYMHPTSPVASALFSYTSVNPVRGNDFMHAFVMGFEAESRIGNAVYPAHYDVGWHITGTAGVFGAAAAIGRLINLSEQEMIWAIGLAATQAAGLREMFGSMAKAFHPGRSAQNGYAAALLAKEGFTAGEYSIEGPRGFAAVQAATYDLSKVTVELGKDFNLRRNTYKPFPCGIVNHPTIDGCIQLHNEHKIDPAQIKSVALRVSPLVMDLCGKKAITKGLEGKFSVVHGAAIGLVRGKAGINEYTDETVNAPDVKRVRESTVATGDPSITDDQARIEVTLADGQKLAKFVEQSLGNIHRPMSDKQLEEKLRDQSQSILSASQIDKVIELCWKIDTLDNVNALVEATVPA
jgi:2-methylcitrate dehydratase PrpD